MPRRLPSFIDSFVEFGSVFNAPDRYLRWAGLWLATTLVTRSVGVRYNGQFMAPNLYINMIGGPGTGKSQAVKALRTILQPAGDFAFIPETMTRAAMEDFMRDVQKWRTDVDGRRIMANEFIGMSDEMQGILPDQDLGHLTMFNRLYDLPNTYTAMTRSNGEVRLEYPYCSLFVGAQPQFLSLTLPEGAWGMGFMSRCIMVFGTPRQRRSGFNKVTINRTLEANLIHDAKAIASLHGWMQWSPAAERLYDTWWVEHGGNPIPQAKRLVMGYNARRDMNMIKMAMGMSLAESDELIVDEPHVAAAIEMLLEAEQYMTHIFNEMAASGSMVAIEDAIDLVRNNTINKKETTEAALTDLLMQRFPATQVQAIITNLVTSGAVELAGGVNATGFRKFRLGKQVGQI